MPEPPITPATRSLDGISIGRLSDRALFSRAAGDEAAFSELVRRYREPLRRHAARYVGDADAEDVVQQALVNASLALRRDPDREIEPRPWLYKVTTNAAIDHRRARAARPLGDRIHEEPDFEALGGAQADDPHEVLTGRETVRSVVARIQGLAPNQRRAATARFLEGRSHDEIAGELGVSKGAARELIHRARRNLREGIPAISPLPLFEKLRQAISGVFAGSASAPAAKLAAGTAAVALAAGGGAAVIASRDGGDDRLRIGAGKSTPAASISDVPRVALEPRGGRASDSGGDRGGRQAGGDEGSGHSAKSGQDAGGAGSSGAPASAAAAAGSSSAATGQSGSSTSVQGVVEDLGVDSVTEELPVPDAVAPPEVPDVTEQLPVKPPSLPPVGNPIGAGN